VAEELVEAVLINAKPCRAGLVSADSIRNYMKKHALSIITIAQALCCNAGGRSSGTIHTTLTNYAVGIAVDTASAIAEFIAPTVATGAQSGQYKVFNSADAFQTYDTARAVGGNRNRIEFNADDAYFNCKPQGLEVAIDDSERDENADPLMIEQAKIRTLVSNTQIGHEKKVVDLIKNAKAATAGVGAWSADADKDVIADIDAQILAILTDTGRMPNAMVLGIGAWSIIKNHASVLSRLGDTRTKSATMAEFANMLLNPEIEIKVTSLTANTYKPGKDGKTQIVGSEILLFVRSANPTQYDPSFAKSFMPSDTPIVAVREYRDEKCASDIFHTDWSEDVQITSTLCGRRIAVS
jgi:hypothetical protein